MSRSNANDFDIVSAEPLPLQSAVRPEPARTLADYLRFLGELEEIVGPLLPNHPGVTTGDLFRL